MTIQQTPLPLQIDIVSDVVCPWCIIGYLQLQKALASLPGQFEVSLNWRPFELNPQMPEEGEDLREHIARKYGATPEQSRGNRERLMALGESLGFHFSFGEGLRLRNTFRAHQLLHWAAEQSRQTELKLALFESYFSRNEDVSSPLVLAAVAARVGLDETEAARVLEDARYAQAVRDEQQVWLDRDVHAVPSFFLNGQYPIPGAQEAETFVRVLNRLRERSAA